jgi:hypothetical protein
MLMADLCTELSLYANGESIGIDSDIYTFSPLEAVKKHLPKRWQVLMNS